MLTIAEAYPSLQAVVEMKRHKADQHNGALNAEQLQAIAEEDLVAAHVSVISNCTDIPVAYHTPNVGATYCGAQACSTITTSTPCNLSLTILKS